MMGTPVIVPHAGPGTHTLVIAVEVPDDMISDPDAHRRIIARATRLASGALRDLTVGAPR